jgi:SAM-dependent methyltransferase
VAQFHHPQGALGRVAGWIMTHRASNLQRSQWTLDLLALEPTETVCELGPGPGAALDRLLAESRHAVAVDHSELMLEQCRCRHPQALADGRLQLHQADFTRLPDIGLMDAIFAVNSLQFDGLNEETLRAIASHLKPGGRMAITFQPRDASPSEEDVDRAARKMRSLLEAAGLTHIEEHRLPLEPVSAVCLLSRKG